MQTLDDFITRWQGSGGAERANYALFLAELCAVLDPVERHKMGAHFTPRAYVERLVLPTVIEPLRAEWDAARAAAITLARQDKLADALKELERFHSRLCQIRVLDSACGSGTFFMSRWSISSAWRARCSTRWRRWASGGRGWRCRRRRWTRTSSSASR